MSVVLQLFQEPPGLLLLHHVLRDGFHGKTIGKTIGKPWENEDVASGKQSQKTNWKDTPC